jgi:hypothetical protein
MNCEYVKNYYKVPAEIGRRVMVDGRRGIIAADRGHYLGVNFDSAKPGVIANVHPTSNVEYLEMGEIRKPSRGAARAARYHEYGDGFRSFIDFCRWDADPERSWNNRTA